MVHTKKPDEKTNIVEEQSTSVSELEELNIETTPEVNLDISQLDGVGAVTAKKLTEFGVTSLIDICIRGGREISEITGVAKSKADGCVFNAQKSNFF